MSQPDTASPVRIGLVGCTKSKLDRPAPAAELYSPSTMFRGRRGYVESTCDRWFILSANHGVVAPDEVLDPYDVTLVGTSRLTKRQWTNRVLDELEERLGQVRQLEFKIHAGHDYWGFGLVEGLTVRGATVEIPTRGLGQGQQLAFYRKAASRRP